MSGIIQSLIGSFKSGSPTPTTVDYLVVAGGAGGGNSTGFYTGTTSSATTGISVSNSTSGVSGSGANMPPYYALAFIMKS